MTDILKMFITKDLTFGIYLALKKAERELKTKN